jgi:hypothetical protein
MARSDGTFTDALAADLADLRTLMGLGIKEAATLETEVQEKTYRCGRRKRGGGGRCWQSDRRGYAGRHVLTL